jgi:Protein of unknown function (DUF2946)
MSEEVYRLMRRRLRKFFPIMLIALTVQIFAPIAACWAASIATSDPLQAAFICHDNGVSAQGQTGGQGGDQTGQHRAHDGCCSFCSVAHTGAPVDAPQTAVTTPYRDAARVVWRDRSPDLFGPRLGSHAQARAPPALT